MQFVISTLNDLLWVLTIQLSRMLSRSAATQPKTVLPKSKIPSTMPKMQGMRMAWLCVNTINA